MAPRVSSDLLLVGSLPADSTETALRAAGELFGDLVFTLPVDGVPGMIRRKTTASRHLADFGVAMYCGFGRQPGQDGMETMRDHHRTAIAARSLTA